MAVELVTRRWCDHCLGATGEKVEALDTSIRLVIEGIPSKGPVEIELCADCDDQVMGPVRTLVFAKLPATKKVAAAQQQIQGLEDQRKDHRRGPQPKDTHIEFCLLCAKSWSSDSGAASHYVTVHKMSMVAVLGNTCPLCNEEEMGYRPLTRHMKDAHPTVMSVSDAFRTAKNLGDQYKVVKEALDRAEMFARK